MAARNTSLGLLAGSLLLMAAGCRGTPPPVTRTEQTPQAAPPVTATPSPAPSVSPPASPALKDPSRDDAPVVVDVGVDDSNAPKTLVEAARAERERRAQAGAPAAIVINDKNIHQYAAKGQITVADPKEKKSAAAPSAEVESAQQLLRDEK